MLATSLFWGPAIFGDGDAHLAATALPSSTLNKFDIHPRQDQWMDMQRDKNTLN